MNDSCSEYCTKSFCSIANIQKRKVYTTWQIHTKIILFGFTSTKVLKNILLKEVMFEYSKVTQYEKATFSLLLFIHQKYVQNLFNS